MEHKVNEIFDFFGTKVKCVDSKNRHCSDCFLFDFAYCYMYTSIIGECNKRDRSDKKSVHFELLNKNE